MRLIDADKLKEEVLKWMPPDPCGQEEREHPFETDIVVSMMMTIEEAETVEAIPLTWINGYLTWLYDMNSVFGNRNALAIQAMLKKWEMEQAAGCKDSCPIGGSE